MCHRYITINLCKIGNKLSTKTSVIWFLTQSIANSGYIDINNRPTRFLHKIKPGDTLSSITQKAGGGDIVSLNPLCNLKSRDGFRVGDVIQYSLPMPN